MHCLLPCVCMVYIHSRHTHTHAYTAVRVRANAIRKYSGKGKPPSRTPSQRMSGNPERGGRGGGIRLIMSRQNSVRGFGHYQSVQEKGRKGESLFGRMDSFQSEEQCTRRANLEHASQFNSQRNQMKILCWYIINN